MVRFNLIDYVHENNADHNEFCENKNVIAISQWIQYLYAIKKAYSTTKFLKYDSINHDDLYTKKLKQLIHIVTYRGEMVNMATLWKEMMIHFNHTHYQIK